MVEKSFLDVKNFDEIILENIPDLVFVKDENFRIVKANPAFIKVYPEHLRDKVIGYTTIEGYDDKEAEDFLAMDKKALEEGISQIQETIQFPDGKTRILMTKKVRFKNNQNEKFILGIARDITEIKEAEKKIIEAEHTKQSYADASSDGYWDWLIQDNYEYMSPRFWEMFGYKPEEKKHHPQEWQDIIFPEDLTIALENFNKHVATKGEHPFSQEVRFYHKNGSTVHVICKGKVLQWDEDGSPIRMIGTHTDITDLKETQENLKSTGKILEDSLNEIYIFDAESLNFVTVNKGARNNIGYSMDELQNLTPIDIKPEVSEHDFKKIITPLIQKKRTKLFLKRPINERTKHHTMLRSTYRWQSIWVGMFLLPLSWI